MKKSSPILTTVVLASVGIAAIVAVRGPGLVPLYDDIGPVAFVGLGAGLLAFWLLFYWLRARYRL